MVQALGSGKRPVLHIRLDLELSKFFPQRRQFLQDVAQLAGVTLQDISIVDLRRGCTIVVISIPGEGQAQFIEAYRRRVGTEGLSRWRIEAVRDSDSLEGRYVTIPLTSASERRLSWLHLSDIHLKVDKDGLLDKAQRERLEHLPDALKRSAPKHGYDFVVISGDVAFSAKTEEYEHATRLMRDVRQAVGGAPLFVVPGNHDAHWGDIDPDAEVAMRTSVQDRARLDELLNHGPSFDYLSARHANFRRFIDSLSDHHDHPALARDSFHFVKEQLVDGRSFKVRVGIAGLNSALLTTDKFILKNKMGPDTAMIPDLDLQNLVLGAEQLQAVSNGLSSADLRIVLMHHPPASGWFRPDEFFEQKDVLGGVDFVLRGHEHLPRMAAASSFDWRDNYFEVAPGALHDGDESFRGFCVTEIDIDDGVVATSFYRPKKNSKRHWVPDVDSVPNGQQSIALPADLWSRLGGGPKQKAPMERTASR